MGEGKKGRREGGEKAVSKMNEIGKKPGDENRLKFGR